MVGGGPVGKGDSSNQGRRRWATPLLVTAIAGAGALSAWTPVAQGSTEPQPAAGEPLADLTQSELDRFFVGKQSYTRDFTEAEGLGPIFNQTACGDCHTTPVGGTGTIKVFRAARVDKNGFDPLEEFGGSLFQLEAISDECREDPPAFANVSTDRVTNGMMGYGLVEAIADQDILDVRAAQDQNIQGDAHMVESFEDPGNMRVGRFGWKAQVATILTFSADAALQEIGLTNRFLTMDNDPNGINPPALGAPDFCDTVADPEDSIAFGNGVDAEFIDVVTDFQRFLTQPPQTPKSGMSGEAIFNSIGCADCHFPQYTTADDPALEDVLRNKVIRPYSDFLLHDMGPALKPPNGGGDGIEQGMASGVQLKTPPLWGLRMRAELWHDGRFASSNRVEEAIVAHNEGFGLSQAAPAADAFVALPQTDKDKLLAFLDSLGRREFDIDDDNEVTITDFHNFGAEDAFAQCFGLGPFFPDDGCAIHDIDQDTDVHWGDFKVFLTVYNGARSDCNSNGVLDLVDILAETSLDTNTNGIPDECEPTCAGDLDGNADVGVSDLLILLGAWGACPDLPDPCPADLNNDGNVDVADLLAVLGVWGSC